LNQNCLELGDECLPEVEQSYLKLSAVLTVPFMNLLYQDRELDIN